MPFHLPLNLPRWKGKISLVRKVLSLTNRYNRSAQKDRCQSLIWLNPVCQEATPYYRSTPYPLKRVKSWMNLSRITCGLLKRYIGKATARMRTINLYRPIQTVSVMGWQIQQHATITPWLPIVGMKFAQVFRRLEIEWPNIPATIDIHPDKRPSQPPMQEHE